MNNGRTWDNVFANSVIHSPRGGMEERKKKRSSVASHYVAFACVKAVTRIYAITVYRRMKSCNSPRKKRERKFILIRDLQKWS